MVLVLKTLTSCPTALIPKAGASWEQVELGLKEPRRPRQGEPRNAGVAGVGAAVLARKALLGVTRSSRSSAPGQAERAAAQRSRGPSPGNSQILGQRWEEGGLSRWQPRERLSTTLPGRGTRFEPSPCNMPRYVMRPEPEQPSHAASMAHPFPAALFQPLATHSLQAMLPPKGLRGRLT